MLLRKIITFTLMLFCFSLSFILILKYESFSIFIESLRTRFPIFSTINPFSFMYSRKFSNINNIMMGICAFFAGILLLLGLIFGNFE